MTHYAGLPLRIWRFMRPQRQSGQAHPRTKAASSGAIQNLLEICAQLTNSSADPAVLLETIAASTRQIFQASATGVLVKDGETLVLKGRVAQPPGAPTRAGVARGGVEPSSAVLLLSQAQPYADEAINKNDLVSFRLAHAAEKKSPCYGL